MMPNVLYYNDKKRTLHKQRAGRTGIVAVNNFQQLQANTKRRDVYEEEFSATG